MIKFCLYFDKDITENWLNNMCGQGWAMKKFFLGFCTFEPCEKGEYTYRVDLLQNWKGNKDDYVSFMEESGVEYAGQWYRWVWLRKKAADGIFELYSDAESLIQQYMRIKRFFIIGFILEMLCGMVEVSSFSTGINGKNAIAAVFIFLLAIIFLNVAVKYNRKIKKLKI